MYCVLCYPYFIQEETEVEGSVKATPVHKSQVIAQKAIFLTPQAAGPAAIPCSLPEGHCRVVWNRRAEFDPP